MNKLRIYGILIVSLIFSNLTYSQNVGISDDGLSFVPNASAVLDLKSTSRGLLIPRMTTAQRDAIASKSDGLLVYNTDTKSFDIYNSTLTVFNKIGFIGTRNLYVGNSSGGALSTGTDNVFVGYQSGKVSNSNFNVMIGSYSGLNCTSANNVFLGSQSGYTATGSAAENVFIGYQSGYSSLSGNNVFVGYQSGYSNSSNSSNVYIGDKAGKFNDNSNNVCLGYEALYNATNISNGVFIGYESAMYDLTNANGCVFIGHSSGRGDNITTPTGTDNVFIGYQSGVFFTTASRNVLVGYQTGQAMTIANDNCLYGSGSGYPFLSGTNNVGFGNATARGLTTGTDNISVGANSGRTLVSNNGNVLLGYSAGYSTTGGQNTMIGYQAGSNNSTGAGNILIGYNAGQNVGASNKLYIDNTNTSSPLIHAEYDINMVQINGYLQIQNGTTSSGSIKLYENANNGTNYITIKGAESLTGNLSFTLPTTMASAGAALSTSGAGVLSWSNNTADGGIETSPLVFPFTATNIGSLTPYYTAVFCRKTVTVSHVQFYVQAVGGGTTDFTIAIFDAASTNNRIARTNQFTVNTAGLQTQSLANPSSVTLNAGSTYYLVIQQVTVQAATKIYTYNSPPADNYYTFIGAVGPALFNTTESTHNASGLVPWISAY